MTTNALTGAQAIFGNGLTNTQAGQNSSSTLEQEATLNQDFNDFLILLTTQVQNQDPLNPMDSQQFTDSLVQFSQVEQQINTNKKLDSLVSNELLNGTGRALSYVGLNIAYPAKEIRFDGENAAGIAFNLEEQALFASLNVRDAEGNVVYSTLVPNAPGTHEVTWDGVRSNGLTADPGTYSFTIDAVDAEGNPIDNIPSIVSGKVTGVESQDGQIFLLVGDRAVPQSQVIRAVEPEPVTQQEQSQEEAA